MATVNDYCTRAISDRDFCESVCDRANPVWAVVVYFYSSLHFVQACLKKDKLISYITSGPTPSQHANRQYLVDKNYPEIADEYETLYNYSRDARYYPTWVPKNLQLTLVKGYAKHIETFSRKHIR